MGCTHSVPAAETSVFKKVSLQNQVDQAIALAMSKGHLQLNVYFKISAVGLPNVDIGTDSDPYFKFFLNGRLIHTSKVIDNNLSPDFREDPVHLTYHFEENQTIRIEMWDENTLRPHILMCTATTTVANIMSKPGSVWTSKMKNPEGSEIESHITIRGFSEPIDKDIVTFSLAVNGVDYGQDYYIDIRKTVFIVGEKADPIWTTKGGYSTNCVSFPDIIHLTVGVVGGWDVPIQISLMKKLGSREEGVGHLQTTLRILQSHPEIFMIRPSRQTSQKMINPEANKSHRELKLFISNFQHIPTFLSYIRGGTEIEFCTAIDFTGSNGDPNMASSLHHHSTDRPNQYQLALRAVGPVLEGYDSNQEFPLFGFGAQKYGNVYHSFSLNGDETNPCVHGLTGIEETYLRSLTEAKTSHQIYGKNKSTLNQQSFIFSGPTFFSPTIHRVIELARATPQTITQQKYFVLLMITDGVINDTDATIEALRIASELPISIIIVGVGNADFSTMDALDGDDGKLGFRDIVQFVPLRDYLPNGHTYTMADAEKIQESVGKALLEEIPYQFLSFYAGKNLMPMQREHLLPPPPPSYEETMATTHSS
jgi:hypothetical protein